MTKKKTKIIEPVIVEAYCRTCGAKSLQTYNDTNAGICPRCGSSGDYTFDFGLEVDSHDQEYQSELQEDETEEAAAESEGE